MEPKSVNFDLIELSDEEVRKTYTKDFAYSEDAELSQESRQSIGRQAKAIKYLTAQGHRAAFDAVVKRLGDLFAEQFRRSGIADEPSMYGLTNAWIKRDMAKQLYFFLSTDRSGTNEARYRLANPLEDGVIQQEIVDRHLGWEVWYKYCSPGNGIRIDDPALKKKVKELLALPQYRSTIGRERGPASWALTKIGALLRQNQGRQRMASAGE